MIVNGSGSLYKRPRMLNREATGSNLPALAVVFSGTGLFILIAKSLRKDLRPLISWLFAYR